MSYDTLLKIPLIIEKSAKNKFEHEFCRPEVRTVWFGLASYSIHQNNRKNLARANLFMY